MWRVTVTDRVVFWILAGLHLVPLFLGRHLLTGDGPAHLYNAALLKDFLLGQNDFSRLFFTLNHNASANWPSHLLLAGLQTMLPGLWAEKLVMAIYLLGLPFAFRYFLLRLNPAAEVCAWLVFPLLYSVVFDHGFYNQCFSYVLLFLLAGRWLEADYTFTLRSGLALALLALLLYFTHPLTYLVAMLAIGGFILDRYLNPAWGGVRRPPLWQTLAFAAAVFAPSAGFVLFFLSHATNSTVAWPVNRWAMLRALATFHHSVAHRSGVLWRVCSLGLMAAFGLGCAWIVRQLPRWKQTRHTLGLAVVLAVLLILYFFMPERIAGGFVIRPRLAWVLHGFGAALVAVFWPTGQSQSRHIRWAFLLLAFWAFSYQIVRIREGQRFLDEVIAAQRYIPHKAVVLPYTRVADPQHEPGLLPYNFRHVSNYVCTGGQRICLLNYEAAEPHFPLRWKHYPFTEGTNILYDHSQGEKPGLAFFDSRSPRLVTHILLIGRPEKHPALSRNNVLRDLRQHFRPVYTSPNRWVSVYARK